MTIRRSRKSAQTSTIWHQHTRKQREKVKQRRLLLERLEDRRVLAAGPDLAGIQPNNGALLVNNAILKVAPTDLTFRFTNEVPLAINPASLSMTAYQSSVRLVRAGNDGQFTSNNVPINPGFISTGDTGMEVVMRFADPLPDDKYRIIIVGAGNGSVLRDTAGNRFNDGRNLQLEFTLDLGAQITAIVPQPVGRNSSGALVQQGNKIDVYFNNDKLNKASAENVNFYQLIVTKDTATPADDVGSIFKPTSVVYTAAQNKATLTFSKNLVALNPNNHALRLRIGTDEAIDGSIYTPINVNDPLSTFAGALNVGALTGTKVYQNGIWSNKPYNIQWPGGNDDPGHRDNPSPRDRHLVDGAGDNQLGIQLQYYNFRKNIGTISSGQQGGSQPAFNLITENQKQRVREVFDLISRYSGIQFVETQDQGFIVATGDLRAVDDPVLGHDSIIGTGPGGPRGLAGLNSAGQELAIMDVAETNWGDLYGDNYARVAMHEIGHLLGLGHAYDLPDLTIMGSGETGPAQGGEPVFPGDADIAHLRRLFRPESADIDMYKFTIGAGQTGEFIAETYAERLEHSSLLDSHLRLYQQTQSGVVEIAINDDYFSKDALIKLQLGAGTYFVGVSAKGNDKYDPITPDSGMGGTSQGTYRLRMQFRPTVASARTIVDTTGTPLDGDGDGTPGGVHNFWFRTAQNQWAEAISHTAPRTLYVDKSAAPSGNGSLAKPFNNIPDALAAATVAGDIVRIVGNGGADGNLATTADNLAYQLGFDQIDNQPLSDGASLIVPKNVTVMIDAGAIFQMRRSRIQVGSTQTTPATDRSGGALQVLGTPTQRVFFTSYNEDRTNTSPKFGTDTNPLVTTPAAGDWGGILFRNDQDRADGRFDWEEQGIFLNYVNFADMRFGGGQVNLDGGSQTVVTPIHMVDARPTVTNNTITRSADAAMSASPNSFEETTFREPRYQPDGMYAQSFNVDYARVGPEIRGNRLVVTEGGNTFFNSLNGLFVRSTTLPGSAAQEGLTVAGRFDDTDIVHIIAENLTITGSPGGGKLEGAVPSPADPTIEDGKPPIELVISSTQSGGSLTAGTKNYRIVYVDLFGNEGRASDNLAVNVPSNGRSVVLSQLPNLPTKLKGLDSDYGQRFVARRIYRLNSSGQYIFVGQVPSTVRTFVDSGATPTFVRRLNPGLLNPPPASNSKFLLRPITEASLKIDPNIVSKFDSSRIDVQQGATLIAEGLVGQEVIFTSLSDDRFGAGGIFDTRGDQNSNPPNAGEWGGIFAAADARLSIDRAEIYYGGGLTRIQGDFAGFNAIEIHQADARVSNTLMQFNGDGTGGTGPASRFGRGDNSTATIFIRGSQPIIVNNVIRDNEGAAMSINVNALNGELNVDGGRQSGRAGRIAGHLDNHGPLIVGNRLGTNDLNGLIVRGGTLTTESVWDDTDIAHILLNRVTILDFHTFGGLRLESSPTESLVVKSETRNPNDPAGIHANGSPLEVQDRIGGTLQIIGQPGFPVVLTSLFDDTVSAGLTPEGDPQSDTNGDGSSGGTGAPPVFPPATGELAVTYETNAMNLVNAMRLRPLPGGVTIPNATYTGAPTAAGTYINGDEVPLQVEPRGILLTTGDANLPVSNTDTGFTQAHGLPGDADLTALAGFPTEDAVVLTMTINVTAASGIKSGAFNFQFGSEEFDEFVGSPFNDVLAGFINGGPATNFIRDSQGNLVSINSGFFNVDNRADVLDVEYDGLTSGLTATFPLRVGTNVLKIALADASDDILDSGAFFSDLRFSAQDVGTGGVGALAGAGDWEGITIDKYANDRNVDMILEKEDPTLAAPGSNASPITAQQLGSLAPNEKSGDENRRLGFTVQGQLNTRNDVDVYSFRADAGTEVWFDIDRTTYALDSVIELIDSDGVLLARSNNSHLEDQGTEGLLGEARRMQRTPPFEGRDFYSINEKDAGMRVVLPGPAGANAAYFVRIRSSSSNINNLTTGLTNGAYQLQIRLQEKDEISGSVIRLADVRYGENGIRVLGHPGHSPLTGEHADVELPNSGSGVNDTQATAQQLGNLARVDRGTVSVAGNLGASADIDWYEFNLDLGGIQGFNNANRAAAALYSLMFDVDYADGLSRPNTQINVYNAAGALILTSRDSNVADDRPAPLSAANIEDLLRGTVGAADPFIGPTYLAAGMVPNVITTYYVAISTDSVLPAMWAQFFTAVPANPLVRFEPVDSITRVAEDRLNRNAAPSTTKGQILWDNSSVLPFNLGDVSLFVERDAPGVRGNGASDLLTVNPFTGAFETFVGTQQGELQDIAFRSDRELFGYTQDVRTIDPNGLEDSLSGHYFQIDTGNGAATDLGDDGIETFELDANGDLVRAHLTVGGRVGYGIQYEALTFGQLRFNAPGERLFAVGSRGEEYLANRTINNYISPRRNLLWQMDPLTGLPLVGGGVGQDPAGNFFGSFSSHFEMGEIVTSAQLIAAEATTLLNPRNIRDRQTTFTVSNPSGDLTFEFDAGPDVLQNYNLVGSRTQTILDGNFFILDPDDDPNNNNESWFQFDTGFAFAITGGSNAFADGETFSIQDGVGGNLNFEFDRDGTTNGNNVAIDISGANLSAVGMANAIANAINAEFAAGNTITEAFPVGNRVSFANNPRNVGNINVGISSGLDIGDVMSVAATPGVAPLLQAVPGSALVDGQQFLIFRANRPAQAFEFDNNGVVGFGNIPVTFNAGMSANQVAVAIYDALEATYGDAVTHNYTNNGSIVIISGATYSQDTSPIVNLIPVLQSQGRLGPQIQILDSDTPDDIGLAVKTVVETFTNFTVGQEDTRINFPPPVDPSPLNNRIPVQRLDVSGMVGRIPLTGNGASQPSILVWDVDPGSGTGTVNGNTPIGFLAEDSQLMIATRIQNAINNELGANFAVADGNRVYLGGNSTFTNATPPLSAQGEGPGGLITGITTLDLDGNPDTLGDAMMYAVSDAGGLYIVDADTFANANIPVDNPAKVLQVNTTYVNSSRNELAGLRFTGLTRGPEDVEGGRYRLMLFGVTEGGRLYAFNTAGQLQPIFADGATNIQLTYRDPNQGNALLPLTNARGLAFSDLDKNLWHVTPDFGATPQLDAQRQGDPGHSAGSSLYFGDPNIFNADRDTKFGSPATPFRSYDAPGGAYGTIVSNEFSLVGKTAADQPVLYFTYFAETDQAADAMRVFISGSDPQNNFNSGDWKIIGGTGGAPGGLGSQVFTNTGGWRQVRIPLDAYAGLDHLRLRLDFSTAGDMNVGDTNTTGDELRTVAGRYINDGDGFTLSNPTQRFEFNSGYTIIAPAGASIQDGDTFTIQKDFDDGNPANNPDRRTVRFEFNTTGGVAAGNVAIPISNLDTAADVARKIVSAIRLNFGQLDTAAGRTQTDSVIPRWLGDNLVNVDFATSVTRTAGSALTTVGSPSVGANSIAVPVHRLMSREDVSQVIDNLLESFFYNQTLVVRATGQAFQDGDQFTIRSGTQNFNYEWETGVVVSIPIGGGGGGGPTVQDGDTIQLRRVVGGSVLGDFTFEFDSNNNLNDNTHLRVAFNTSDTQLQIARKLQVAIDSQLTAAQKNNLGIIAAYPAVISGARVQIGGGAGLNVTTSGAFSTTGVAGVSPGFQPVIHVPSAFTSAAEVAQELNTAFNVVGSPFRLAGFSSNYDPNDPARVSLQGGAVTPFQFSQSVQRPVTLEAAQDVVKTHKDLIRIIGHSVLDAGPLGLANSLPLDLPTFDGNGNLQGFNNPIRGQNNKFEGVYVDDFVIGFAERGELVTGATGPGSVVPASNDYLLNPFAAPNQVTVGEYQLEIRRGPDYVPGSIDTNDRLDRSLVMTAPAGADIADGKTFTLSDGNRQLTFEFDLVSNNSVTQGNVRIPFTVADRPEVIARAIREAINSNPVQAVLKISAQVSDGTLFGQLSGGPYNARPSNANQVNFIGAVSLQPLGDPAPEPNELKTQAKPLNLTQATSRIINGTIGDKPGSAAAQDYDLFRQFLSAGQTLYVDIDARQFGSPLDSLLRLFDSNGAQILSNNNSPAPGERGDTVDSWFRFTATTAGTYYIGVSGIGNNSYNINTGGNTANGSTGSYQLEVSLSQSSSTEIVNPLTPLPITGGVSGVPFHRTGLTPAVQQVQLVTGVTYYFDVDSQDGMRLDSVLNIYNGGISPANLVATNDNGTAPGEAPNGDSYLEFTPATTGVYRLQVTAKNSNGFVTLIGTATPPSALDVRINDERYGDNNQFRDQGQIILDGNFVSHSANWGIFVGPGTRDNGGAPHQSPPRVLREVNNERLAPGVVVMNNVVFNNAVGGIRFGGSVNNAGQEVGAVPFGRIINNTVYGLGANGTDIGIRVQDNASPTLLNNIVANLGTGISVTTNSNTTVLGGTVYQNNGANTAGISGGANAFRLNPGDPLFVNASQGNFYPAAGSLIIDSSIDSLLDRPAMVTVRSPLGIPPSPILAPDRDATGSLRVDDPNTDSPSGAGENVFKDRGAIDRVDFEGPTSVLLNPRDNDEQGIDGDPTPTRVSLGNISLFSFDIQLNDVGIGVDDNTVLTSAVRVQEILGSVTRTLVDGTDYIFSYDRTNNRIILRPTSGIWTLGRNYRITLDNTGADGIRDQAGNLLQPNRVNGTVVYEIFLGTAIDWGDAPASYGTTRAANGPSHQIRGILKLGTQVSPDLNGQPSPTASADTFDDGLINYFLAPGQASSLTVLAQGGGKLDAWLDRNKDGDFLDAGERIIVGATLPHNVLTTLNFNFGSKSDVKGDTFLRLRYTSNGISSPLGPASDGEVEDYLVTLTGPKYQNPTNRLDVDNNGFVQPRDALLIVNLINNFDLDGDGIVNPETDLGNPAPNPPPYYDVNGDGLITQADAQLVVNFINSSSSSTTSSTTSDNHAPVLDNSPVTRLNTISSSDSDPAGTLIHKLVKTAVTDADSATIKGIAVTQSTGYGSGTWQYRFDKLPWTNLGKVSESGARLLPARAYIRFVPNPGFSGDVTLRYRAWDQTQGVPGFLFNTTNNLGGSKAFSLSSEIARLRVTSAAAATSSSFASSSIVYEQNSQTPTEPEAPAVDAVFSTAATTTTNKQTYSLLSADENSDGESKSSTGDGSDFEELTDDFFTNF